MKNLNNISLIKQKRTPLIVLILILLCTILMAGIGSLRERLHIDEIWSFGLSNNNGAPFYYDYVYGVGDSYLQDSDEFDYHNEQEYKDYFNHWHTSDYYLNYLTVQEDEKFDFENVFENQSADTHPPLYYCVIHAVCSLFPNCFSIWLGLVPNLLFYALSLLLLYLISRELLDSEYYAILAMLLWGLSRAGVTEVLFLRMYMMESFFALLLTYTTIKLIRRFCWMLILLISIVEIAGFLTHYYFYIFAFFLTLFTCLYLLISKQIKRMLFYGFAAILSVGTSIAVFPAVIRHLTHGTWSTHTGNEFNFQFSFFEDLSNLLNQVISFYSGADANVLVWITIFLPLVALGLFILQARYHKTNPRKDKNFRISSKFIRVKLKAIVSCVLDMIENKFPIQSIIVCAVLSSGLLIARVEPDMEEYIIRYIFVILPLFSIFILFLLKKIIYTILKKTKLKEYAKSFLVLTVAMLVLSSNIFEENVLLKSSQVNNDISFKNQKLIVANVESYRDHAFSPLYLEAEAVYPIDELGPAFTDALSTLDSGETVTCVFHSEFASVDVIDYYLSEIPGLLYFYISTEYIPLEVNEQYHIYIVKINS